ncbi:hypothetical protein Sango_0250000 [Sesamum angolense]|uniref:BED-type domain-containing protein n=1 Tax=Sesamum angolense TaxID=2727404 RepID=A0AAE2C7Q5_9LAMI|nr:hypothetical protein Sango_0250000 [Sesamum angolense]
MEWKTLEDDIISNDEMRLEDEGISDIPLEESQPHRLPKRKDTCKRSKVWDHFIAYTNGEVKPRARCKYCERNYAADPCKNDTSTMKSHLKACKKYPDNTSVASNHTITSFCQSMDVKESCSHVKFDQEALRYETYDADFRNDFMPDGSYGKIGLPLKHNWVMVRKFVKVLRYFYDLTNRVSGSLYVTSNTFLDETSDVDDLLNERINGDNVDLVDMTRQMKAKFDKYWENIEKMNMMLYVVVMLDPRHRFFYLRYVFKNVNGPEIGEKMGDLAISALYYVFE